MISPTGIPLQVTYGTPSVTGGSRPLNIGCAPESGATFPVGQTTVTCTATDAKRRTSSCNFTVAIEARKPLTLTRFVAFGDSITWGQDGRDDPSLTPMLAVQPVRLFGQEYPTDLLTALRVRYPLQATALEVRNAGDPGEQAGDPDAVVRFRRDVLGLGYQAVLLREGSNDLNEAARSGSSFEDAAITNLRTMVRMARSANMQVFLATVPPMVPMPCCFDRTRGSGLVSGFNIRISSLAQSEGVTLVDVFAGFHGDDSLLGFDGLHPNAAGYQRIADTFATVLVETLEER